MEHFDKMDNRAKKISDELDKVEIKINKVTEAKY